MSLEIIIDKEFTKSYNHNFLALDNQTGERWVGKINRRLKNICDYGNPDIYDLNERSLLAFDLANLIGVNVPKTKTMELDSISNKSFLERIDETTTYNFDNIVLSKYIDRTVVSELEDISLIPLSNILSLLVFDSWVGNLDKKEEDYIFDQQNKQLWSIDYQVWGPRDKETKKVLGFCVRLYDFTEQNIIEFCIPERMRNLLIDFDYFNELNQIITKIESISDQEIQNLVNKYNFRGTQKNIKNNLNQTMVDFLIESRDQIRERMTRVLGLIESKSR